MDHSPYAISRVLWGPKPCKGVGEKGILTRTLVGAHVGEGLSSCLGSSTFPSIQLGEEFQSSKESEFSSLS